MDAKSALKECPTWTQIAVKSTSGLSPERQQCEFKCLQPEGNSELHCSASWATHFSYQRMPKRRLMLFLQFKARHYNCRVRCMFLSVALLSSEPPVKLDFPLERGWSSSRRQIFGLRQIWAYERGHGLIFIRNEAHRTEGTGESCLLERCLGFQFWSWTPEA